MTKSAEELMAEKMKEEAENSKDRHRKALHGNTKVTASENRFKLLQNGNK